VSEWRMGGAPSPRGKGRKSGKAGSRTSKESWAGAGGAGSGMGGGRTMSADGEGESATRPVHVAKNHGPGVLRGGGGWGAHHVGGAEAPEAAVLGEEHRGADVCGRAGDSEERAEGR
jgi:hypothetical protein